MYRCIRSSSRRKPKKISRKYIISRYTIQSWFGLRSETKFRQIAHLQKDQTSNDKNG